MYIKYTLCCITTTKVKNVFFPSHLLNTIVGHNTTCLCTTYFTGQIVIGNKKKQKKKEKLQNLPVHVDCWAIDQFVSHI